MRTSDNYLPALGFRWLTPFYDCIAGLTTRERTFKQALLEQAAIEPGWRVLDLACGTGTLTLWAKQQHSGISIVGLDGDPQILEIAGKKARAAQLDVEFCQGLSHELPFTDASFDCVLSSLFFHHLQPPQKASTLCEVKRVLRPGAELHVADWGAASGPLSRLLFYSVQFLDGCSNTADHVAGRLPRYISGAGFQDARVCRDFETIYGTLSLFRGTCAAA